MIGLLTGIIMVTFFGQNDLTDFKQVEYNLNQTYGDVYTKCDNRLSSITYAFAIKETGNGKGLKQNNKNNLFGLRNGSAKTAIRPKFAGYDLKYHTPSGYNIYNNREDSIYDFMNQFYLRGCKLTKQYVKTHKNGSRGGWNGVDEYYNFLIKEENKYKNKVKERIMIKGYINGDKYGLSTKNVNNYMSGISIIDTRDMIYYIY